MQCHSPFCSSLALWKKALVRPFAMFATEPIIQLFGLYMAFIYGTIYRKYQFLRTHDTNA